MQGHHLESHSKHLLRSIDVGDVITLDPLDIPPSSEPRKRNEDVVGQCDDIPMAVDERRSTLLVLRIQNRHEKGRLHSNSSVKVEDRSQAVLNGVIQRSVLRRVCFEIVEDAS